MRISLNESQALRECDICSSTYNLRCDSALERMYERVVCSLLSDIDYNEIDGGTIAC